VQSIVLFDSADGFTLKTEPWSASDHLVETIARATSAFFPPSRYRTTPPPTEPVPDVLFSVVTSVASAIVLFGLAALVILGIGRSWIYDRANFFQIDI
jgi:hypothetical protein